jgi:hypothetical protein
MHLRPPHIPDWWCTIIDRLMGLEENQLFYLRGQFHLQITRFRNTNHVSII